MALAGTVRFVVLLARGSDMSIGTARLSITRHFVDAPLAMLEGVHSMLVNVAAMRVMAELLTEAPFTVAFT